MICPLESSTVDSRQQCGPWPAILILMFALLDARWAQRKWGSNRLKYVAYIPPYVGCSQNLQQAWEEQMDNRGRGRYWGEQFCFHFKQLLFPPCFQLPRESSSFSLRCSSPSPPAVILFYPLWIQAHLPSHPQASMFIGVGMKTWWASSCSFYTSLPQGDIVHTDPQWGPS